MKQYLETVIKNIMKRQEDIVKAYEGKLSSQTKENKELVKRIVHLRNPDARTSKSKSRGSAYNAPRANKYAEYP